ncbi:LysR substrate-binding domain-containing protein [Arenibaculum pallidiluteum]|uniref:LysR substrate-binding domain-containing protein n=1 Tax=Arenibaculum pallidiluteum TaxID=2812559 RepID=UPI001A965394|nr:LysR substrate-binding domain-containing protein [Arenibaculum pallidiluteum]
MAANLDTDLLRAFVAVAESCSFTRAASALLRTQAAVSQQIRRLEEVIGQRVFERDAKGVRLTPDGEVLLAYARRMLTLNDEAMAVMLRGTRAASVRIGTPDDYAVMLLPPVLARFAEAYPEIAVEVVCDNSPDLVSEVAKGRCDLALVTQRPGTGIGERVRREPVCWVAPPQGALECKDPLPLALFPKGCLIRDLVMAALDESARSWRVAFTSESIVAVHGAVLGGVAISAMEACTVPPALRFLKDGLPTLGPVDIALHRTTGQASGPVHRLAEAIHDLLRE